MGRALPLDSFDLGHIGDLWLDQVGTLRQPDGVTEGLKEETRVVRLAECVRY